MPKKAQMVHIRIPMAVYRAAVMVAEAERRSLNGQLVVWLERGMPDGITDEAQADLALAAEAGK